MKAMMEEGLAKKERDEEEIKRQFMKRQTIKIRMRKLGIDTMEESEISEKSNESASDKD